MSTITDQEINELIAKIEAQNKVALEIRDNVTAMKSALDWYAEQATRVHAYVLAADTAGVMAVMRELASDNGRRAKTDHA